LVNTLDRFIAGKEKLEEGWSHATANYPAKDVA